MQEPILRGHDELRNPCDRVGPFSLDYYRALPPSWSPRCMAFL
jgi:hypothetical protein